MKILILFFFALAYNVSSCNISKKSSTKQNGFVDSNKISATINLNTVKTDVYDTLPGSYLSGFIRDSILTKFFKSRFVNDICEPGNNTHPAYKHFEKEGSNLAAVALKSLIDQVDSEERTKREIEKRLTNISDLKDCRLSQVMVYYLTFNVVLYDKEKTSLNHFYNLDTTSITYCLLHKNKLIGLVNYRKTASIVRSFGDYDSLSYHKVLSLKKTPIALKNSFKIPEVNLSERFLDCFGYTQNNHIFFSRYDQGNYYLIQQGKNKGKIVQQNCTTQAAESYFIKGAPSLLNQTITRAYNLLINQKK